MPPSPSTATDYATLRGLLDDRRRALKMTMCELDQISGVQEGYSSKLFCGARNFGWMSMGLILGALGVEIALVPSRAGRGEKCSYNKDLALVVRNKKWGSAGGRGRRAAMTRQEWSAFCSRAARAKWRAHRRAKRNAGKG